MGYHLPMRMRHLEQHVVAGSIVRVTGAVADFLLLHA